MAAPERFADSHTAGAVHTWLMAARQQGRLLG
jgi:hypothetical protein